MTALPAGFFQKPLYKRRKMRYNGKAFAQRGIAQLVEQRSPKPRAEGSNPSAPAKALTERSELFCFRPPSCLPCVRGGAERMRSGGVVGTVQEKMACNRKPGPIRYLQPLSQGLTALPAPLFDRGRFCGNAGRHRTPQKSRFCGGPLEFHRFPASELPKIGRRHSPAGAARDLPRAARAAQCRREPVFRRLRRFD